MVKNDFLYGGWNYYTVQCGTIMTLISPGNCVLQCGMWLWNHDSEFTKWQHPVMWHIAPGSWHWIRQVAAPCNVAGGSTIRYDSGYLTCSKKLSLPHGDDMLWNSPKRPPYWNSTSGFNFDHITAVDMSFCTSLQKFTQIGPPSAEKMTSCRFSRWRISAILDFKGPVMGSLKSRCIGPYDFLQVVNRDHRSK